MKLPARVLCDLLNHHAPLYLGIITEDGTALFAADTPINRVEPGVTLRLEVEL